MSSSTADEIDEIEPLPDSGDDSESQTSPSPSRSVTDSETSKQKGKGKKTKSDERVYGPNSPTGKRQVNDWTLAPEVEAKAVPWLESHDILWDKRHPNKNRKDLIEETWQEMAREFPPYTGEYVKLVKRYERYETLIVNVKHVHKICV